MTNIAFNNINLHLFKKPSKKDISLIKDNFSFHPSVISELTHPTLHPKIESYDGHGFLVLRFPQFDKHDPHNLISSEVDFIFNKDRLVIVQYQDFKALDVLITRLRHEEEIQGQFFQNNSGYLLYKILDNLFRSLYTELDHITEKVDAVEEQIFDEEKEEEILRLISFYRREAIDFRRIVKPDLDVFKELSGVFVSLFDQNTAFYLNSAKSVNTRLISLIENHIETLHILHETNVSLLTNKANEVMKRLTIFAVIVFPLTLLSSIWGMNVANIPFSENPNGFWIMAGIMGAGMAMMLFIFKAKKWI